MSRSANCTEQINPVNTRSQNIFGIMYLQLPFVFSLLSLRQPLGDV